jgi:hypothetical protein
MANDKDGDKRISREEAPPQLQAFFDKLDADADGYISAAEAQAAQARMKTGGVPPAGGGQQ